MTPVINIVYGGQEKLEATVEKTSELIRETATINASCVSKKESADAVYLESCYLYVHLLSRLLFAQHGIVYRTCFVLPLFVDLVDSICADQIGHKTKQELFADMNSREMYYSRYPCCDEDGTDFSFIFQAFAGLVSAYVKDIRCSYRIEMTAYNGFQQIMRRIRL